jgi:hypothetical protein
MPIPDRPCGLSRMRLPEVRLPWNVDAPMKRFFHSRNLLYLGVVLVASAVA